jgi:hypothetical protein
MPTSINVCDDNGVDLWAGICGLVWYGREADIGGMDGVASVTPALGALAGVSPFMSGVAAHRSYLSAIAEVKAP